MTSLNLSLPKPLKACVESKVEAGDTGRPANLSATSSVGTSKRNFDGWKSS